MGKHSGSIDSQVLARIRRKRPGVVFGPKDFLDLGTRNAVGLALMRHCRAGTIRRVGRGLYDVPAAHPLIGTLAPDVERTLRTKLEQEGHALAPTGAHAANLLGLTEQVPMRMVYLTDGPGRTVQVGHVEVVLKNTGSRFLATRTRIGALVIQALRHWGLTNTGDREYNLLRSRIPYEGRQELLKDLKAAPAWVADIMRRLAQEPHTPQP
jgi:hypothetical protein